MTPRGITWLGVFINIVFTVGKVLAGIFCHSQTILADGFHTLSDLVTDVAVLAGLRFSGKPADMDHHYGHMRITTLVAMFVGAALLGAAAWIAYNAIITLHSSHSDVKAMLPFWVALISFPVKELLYHLTHWVGKKFSDISLSANAWHHRTDAFAALAAAAGLAGVAFGGQSWAFLDHLTAVVLSAFLTVVAVKIVYESASELIDCAPSEKTIAVIEELIANTKGVKSYHAFRARKSGGRVEMDLHIQVDPNLTVHDGHDIARSVRNRILQCGFNVTKVIVHIEPAE